MESVFKAQTCSRANAYYRRRGSLHADRKVRAVPALRNAREIRWRSCLVHGRFLPSTRLAIEFPRFVSARDCTNSGSESLAQIRAERPSSGRFNFFPPFPFLSTRKSQRPQVSHSGGTDSRCRAKRNARKFTHCKRGCCAASDRERWFCSK